MVPRGYTFVRALILNKPRQRKPRSVRRVASTRSKGEAGAEWKNGTNVISGKRKRLSADMDVPF